MDDAGSCTCRPFLSTLLVAFTLLLLLLSSVFGRPSYGMVALLLARTLLAGFIIGFTFIHNSAGPGLYYLAGTYYQDLDKRAACFNSRPVDCLELDQSTFAPTAWRTL